MAFEPKDMSGVLFKNRDKEKDNQPDFTGNVLINGKKYRLSAWKKMSKEDQPFLSLAVSEFEARERKAERQVRDAFDM